MTVFYYFSLPKCKVVYLCDIFTASANLAGVPAVNVPAGLSDGLPLGVQLTAPHRKEKLLLAAAAHLEGSWGGCPDSPLLVEK